MSSKELVIINSKLPVEVVQARKETVNRWLMNFGNDTSKRIPVVHINMQAGMEEHHFFHLKKTFEHKELIGIVALQLADLQEFLNVKSKMSAKQVFDTAEFIVDAFEGMSFTLVQDCFNRIKKAEYPFNGSLYNSIDGRKIMDALQQYDSLVDEEIFGDDLIKHKARLRSSMDNPSELDKMIKRIVKDK